MLGLCKLLSTFFLVGFIPGPSGTWGSLAAFAIYLALPSVAVPYIIALFLLLGTISSHIYAKSVGKRDPREVVVDEAVGMWISLLPSKGLWLIFSFLVFRTLDIAKPFPISWMEEKLQGGLGIMMDDVVAGLITALLVLTLRKEVPGW